jgi:phosphate acetyltransferase
LIFQRNLAIFKYSWSSLPGSNSNVNPWSYPELHMNRPVLHPALRNLSERAKRAVSRRSPPNLLVAIPNQDVLEFLADIASGGLVVPILVGPETELRAQWDGISRSRAYIIDAQKPSDIIKETQKYVREERTDVMLWGGLSANELAEVVGTAEGRILSHLAAVALPTRDSLLVIGDGGWIHQPNLKDTEGIIRNCIDLLCAIGIDTPKIAVLSPVEDVDPRIPRTMDAAALSQMSQRNLFAPAIVDGPLRFDHAIALPEGHEPPFYSPVAGKADAVVAGSMEEANILIKALVHLGKAQFGGLLLGGSVPVACPSWHGPGNSPLLSLVLAILVWHATVGEN